MIPARSVWKASIKFGNMGAIARGPKLWANVMRIIIVTELNFQNRVQFSMIVRQADGLIGMKNTD